MSKSMCVTCGTAFSESSAPPVSCPICEDSRQYVGWNGQQWTTLEQLRAAHRNRIEEEEPEVYSIWTSPQFAIGQRAFLIRTPEGNILWDCVSLLDETTAERLEELGGVRAIAISHPHYYSSMGDWSKRFGDVPIYLHAAERQWVMDTGANSLFWEGEERVLFGGLRLIRTAGHFDGYQVLLWPEGAEGRGALFAGDQPQVCMDRRWVSFLYSYPNMIPLGVEPVRHIARTLLPLPFDRLYGAFPGKTIRSEAKDAVEHSARRYLSFISADL